MPAEDRRDDMQLYHKVKLSELQRKAPFVSAAFRFLVTKSDAHRQTDKQTERERKEGRGGGGPV